MRWLSAGLLFFSVVTLAEPVQEADDFFREFRAQSSGEIENTDKVMRGQLRPVNHTVLSSTVDAKLIEFPVKTGSRVSDGEVIARFKCDVEKADLLIGQSRVKVAQDNLQVNERLAELNNVSGIDLSTSIEELAIAQAEVERTRAILSDCVVEAPFAGVVTEKFVQAHQYLQKGDTLVEIVDTVNLEVEMVLPSLELARYQVGAMFSLRIDETGQTVQAELVRIVDVIDPVSQTLRVIGKLVDPPEGLMPGMSGVVSF